MRLIQRLERRFHPFAIPNLTLLLVAGQAAVFVMGLMNPAFLRLFVFSPADVLQGEVWRLLTFVFYPPLTPAMNPLTLLFAFFGLYLFFLTGSALEANWGAFRYNIYLLVGFLAVTGTALVVTALGYLPEEFGARFYQSNAFLAGTVFLAFAYYHPDFRIMLFLIVPVKIKWLAVLAFAGYLFSFGLGLATFAQGGWFLSLMTLATLLNFLLFFGRQFPRMIRDTYRSLLAPHRRAKFAARQRFGREEPMHVCAVCGVNNLTHPDLDFRYCTQCTGGRAYCPEHLRNHEHVIETRSNA